MKHIKLLPNQKPTLDTDNLRENIFGFKIINALKI